VTAWKPRILVIGAGAGGLAAAVGLLRDGFDDLLVVDRAGGVGGVWRDNTYPGAQCDVPSHLYSFSFRAKPDWKRRFADQDEILGYLQEVVTGHGLTPYLRFDTEAVECRWDDDSRLWRVRLRASDGTETVHPADIVITATGQLSTPAIPRIPGLDRFAGPVWHSARWRHDVDLSGQRVGVIGTGASATQFVPVIAPSAAGLEIFQRSAPYIIGKPNRFYSPLEQKLYAAVPGLQRLSRLRQYLWHEMLGLPFTKWPGAMRIPTRSWRRRLDRAVPDPDLRAKLTPHYVMGCKRLLRSPDWYRTLTRPDVELVTEAIREVRPDGVLTVDGRLHRLDVLILGTGFEATRFLTPMRVTGREGRELDQVWQDGARAYLGTAVSGFPNLFLLYGPGTNLGHSSILFMIESQIAWIRSALTTMRANELSWIDVRPPVQAQYDAWFTAAGAGTVWETGCSSWYTSNGRNTTNWPATTIGFRRLTRRFRPTDVHSGRRP
jgi:cation diffusion facilitator CzcD-associated flavoprotein CzcO